MYSLSVSTKHKGKFVELKNKGIKLIPLINYTFNNLYKSHYIQTY